jgi:hypothetical protein
MTDDPALDDLNHLRRRVVEPVVRSLVRPDELEEIDVRIEDPWPLLERAGVVRPAELSGPGWHLKVAIRARGEWIEPFRYFWVGPSSDLEMFATDLYEALRDQLVESKLSWGEWRDGEYEVLGPLQS